MNRRRFLGMAAATILTALILAGCGGGGGGGSSATVFFTNRSSTSTSIGDVTVQPTADQSGLMPSSSTIVANWPSLADAPGSFSMSLWRYKEGRGGEDPAEYRDTISASQPNPAVAQYSLRRSSSNLDAGGVYYLSLVTSSQIKTYAFVASRDRSVMIPAPAPSRVLNITNPGGVGTFANLTLHWTDEQDGSANIPQQATFTLQFPSDTQAPSQFSVRIGRWKEGRGTAGFSYDEQVSSVTHTGNGLWNVYRRDNFLLDQGGTYILEINNPALTQPLRYAFIVQR